MSRDTSHYYDKIGLLSPAVRGKNTFRYYSAGQMAEINLIRILQDSGLTLEEIKALRGRRPPERVDVILSRQIEKSDKRLIDCVRTRQLLSKLQKSIRSMLYIDEEAITIQSLPQEVIVLGDMNGYSAGGDDFDALTGFHHSILVRYPDWNVNYPAWGAFYEICGDAYEEYPLNEICIADRTNYLTRVMITVREK